MKKLAVTLSVALSCAWTAYAVELPDFAFTGQEITGFSARPSFKHVAVSFSVESSAESYLKQETISLKGVESSKYTSEDPGGMYSGGFGTAISSVFVGEKAYRNNIVKGYLDRQYLDVISSYNSYYEKKLKDTGLKEEVNLVYAFALLETGAITPAMNVLKDIAAGTGRFQGQASDRVAEYLMASKSYEEMDIYASGLAKMTPFTLYNWLFSLTALERFERVISVFEANEKITAENPRFYDFYINAVYSLGRFKDVAGFKGRASYNTAGIIADACLVTDNKSCADELYPEIPDSEMKKVIAGKIALSKENYEQAERILSSLQNDEDRLNLFFFYIYKHFPELDLEFVDRFSFTNRISGDYIKFYKGLYYLSKREYMNSVRSLDGVVFNRELINTSYYYRGLAYASVDRPRAQRYLLKFIESGNDDEKLNVARYMLGQLFNMDGRTDDALMLLQVCSTDYCRVLKGRIFIARNDPDSAWAAVKDVLSDDGAFVRASVLYNRKNYKDALAQLNSAKQKSPEIQLLMMLCWLKTGDTASAAVIFNKNSSDMDFVNAYVEHLFLAGQYQQVLNVTEKNKDSFRLLRAKALFSLGKTKQASEEFRSLLSSGRHSFDAWYGLLSSYSAAGDKNGFADAAKEIAESTQNFDKKDFLILQTAKMALDGRDTRLATMMLNSFFDNFSASVYMREAHLLRGQLFRDTGRQDQCLADADMMLKDGKSDEAAFLKGECLQKSSPAAALKIFEDLAANSTRFSDLSYGKLIGLYSSPADIKRAVLHFKDKDSRTYAQGLEKYLAMLGAKDLAAEKTFVERLIADGNPLVLPSAYYYSGQIYFNDKNYEESARLFMKSYYLFPTSDYAVKSLEKAVVSYEKLGKSDDAGIVRSKLKSVKTKN